MITGRSRDPMPHRVRALQRSDSVGWLALRGLPEDLHRRAMAFSLQISSPTHPLCGG